MDPTWSVPDNACLAMVNVIGIDHVPINPTGKEKIAHPIHHSLTGTRL